MWWFRPRPLSRLVAIAAILAAGILIPIWFPLVSPFATLVPTVLLCAFLGGPWFGSAALVVATAYVAYAALGKTSGDASKQELVDLAFLLIGGVAAILVVYHRDKAVGHQLHVRRRLESALKAANAAVWELSPDGNLYWDENFYALVGLAPEDAPPETARFLAMVHPEDRHRMAEARRLMDAGVAPKLNDEYRLIRPNGDIVWLSNHRTKVSDERNYFIGITQDITRRKMAEEQVRTLMREAAHRAKNQFSVILAMARETGQTSQTAKEFVNVFAARLRALSRSHDLLVGADWKGAGLRDLLAAQLEPFGASARCEMAGPDLRLSPAAAQYLGMAFHELATNAAKYGALAVQEGRIRVLWRISEDDNDPVFHLTWTETGGPAPLPVHADGFGTKVLSRLTPSALSGTSELTMTPPGVTWSLRAPLSAVRDEGENTQENSDAT